MSTYAPSFHRTAELRATDRALVRLGELLTVAGRRRAERRAERMAAEVLRTATLRRRDAHHESVVEHLRDNTAQISPLGLR